MCIVNTDDSTQPGTHWLSLIKNEKGIYCYDSFNRNIHNLSNNFKHKKWISANKDRDESYKEEDCGTRSLAYLISFHKHGSQIIPII